MNKKGFAISVILYSIVFLVVSIMFMLLGIVKTRYTVNDKLKQKIIEDIDDIVDISPNISSYTCTISGEKNDYVKDLTISINVPDNKAVSYSFDGVNYTNSNETIASHSGTYVGYFKDINNNIGNCSVDVVSKTIYRSQNCSRQNINFGEFYKSSETYSNDCIAVSKEVAISNYYTFYRTCSGAGGIHVCENDDGSTCYHKTEYFRNIIGCNWGNETSSWSSWSPNSISSSRTTRVESSVGYKIKN